MTPEQDGENSGRHPGPFFWVFTAIAALGALVVLFSQFTEAFGFPSLRASYNEEPGWVIGAAAVLMFAVVLWSLGRSKAVPGRTVWINAASLVSLTCPVCLLVASYATSDAESDRGAPDLSIESANGAKTVTATAGGIKAGQQLVLRVLVQGSVPGYEGYNAEPYDTPALAWDGKATASATIGPVVHESVVRVVAFVRGRDQPGPKVLRCDAAPRCSTTSTPLNAAPKPQLSVSINGTVVRVRVAKDGDAPHRGNVRVVMVGALGHASRQGEVATRPFATTIRGRRLRRLANVCVLATWDQHKLPPDCRKNVLDVAYFRDSIGRGRP